MNKTLHLQIPSFEELWYREQLLCDPKTMEYNKGYELTLDGYDNNTGCISFPKSKWQKWYDWFINNEPNRFYAYIALENNTFIGEVNLYNNLSNNIKNYEMGIVIEHKYRGNGYSLPALSLLLKQAFEVFHGEEVHNSFESSRESALYIHLKFGFDAYNKSGKITNLRIKKSDYFKMLSP